MEITFRCDCGETTWEQSTTVGEFDRTVSCATCGASFVTTVTRIDTPSPPAPDHP